MVNRKIWVKRPGASATLVPVHEGDLVDDVRDMILKKYANSLGRSFDSPDVTLRIVPRDQPLQETSPGGERTLGPEEAIGWTLDAYFPGGQTVDEALIIDVPHRRTPRPSPRTIPHVQYYAEDIRPGHGGDYFPQMPAIPSPHLPTGSVSSLQGQPGSSAHHAIAVLNTGQVPSLPSPGSIRSRHPGRPRMHAPETQDWSELKSSDVQQQQGGVGVPAPPPLPTSPMIDGIIHHKVGTPPARVSSPRNMKVGKRGGNKGGGGGGQNKLLLIDGLSSIGAVPPINVLLVEDNIINLKLLEAFMKKLKVRWQTAMNGREAVTKWRAGGFHLVLMDIQLPVMNGLDATKEIRRLERIHSIGVFSSSASSHAPAAPGEEPTGEDCLEHVDLFKSPVIIVALTASSLQSDRHEALAAGCNDFLTKPVNFVWLERKVMEWGCMQALIDFDGWRKWKDFSSQGDGNPNNSKNATGGMAKSKKDRLSGKNIDNGAVVMGKPVVAAGAA